MKTETLKSDPEKKAEMIKAFAEALDKNTASHHEVWQVLHALQECFKFMVDQRWEHDPNIMSIARYIEDVLIKKNQGIWLDQFTKMADSASETMIISNQCCEGVYIIRRMEEEIEAIEELYGS
jgi:hypothetical protein